MRFLRTNAIALCALFVALGGTGYAAATITGKQVRDSSLTGKDIKNRSLTTKDFKGKLPAGPSGPQGPAGPAGAPGSAGAAGAQGERGPSDAWTASASGLATDLTDQDTTLATVPLPAGTYVVDATLDTYNTDTGDEVLASCRAGGAVHRMGYGSGQFWDRYRTFPVHDVVSLDAPGAIALRCKNAGGLGSVRVTAYRVTATQVATLHG